MSTNVSQHYRNSSPSVVGDSKYYATLSEAWANEDEDVVVLNGEYSSKHYSLKAKEESDKLFNLEAVATTSAPGTEASADWDRGTATMTFTIPRGDVGPVGPVGPPGAFNFKGDATVAEINSMLPGDFQVNDAYKMTTSGTLNENLGYIVVAVNDFIVWTDESIFYNIGPIEGAQGPQGYSIIATNVVGDNLIIQREAASGTVNDGPFNVRGHPGLDGLDGKDGAKGDQGDPGPKGDTGDTGPQGEQGPQGDGVVVRGSGTIAEIEAWPDKQRGDMWISTENGTLTGGYPVFINDCITWDGTTLTNVGPILPINPASEAERGLIRLAPESDVIGGVNPIDAVTPATLQAKLDGLDLGGGGGSESGIVGGTDKSFPSMVYNSLTDVGYQNFPADTNSRDYWVTVPIYIQNQLDVTEDILTIELWSERFGGSVIESKKLLIQKPTTSLVLDPTDYVNHYVMTFHGTIPSDTAKPMRVRAVRTGTNNGVQVGPAFLTSFPVVS